jgi:hypothetical protein
MSFLRANWRWIVAPVVLAAVLALAAFLALQGEGPAELTYGVR